MPRKTLAAWLVVLGLALGLLGNLFFYQKFIGLSFPLFILVAVVVTLAASRPAQTPVRWRNLWPVIPMLFFAGMVAVRADSVLLGLNMAAAIGLGGLALHYLPLAHPLDESPLERHITAVLESAVFALFAALPEVADSWGWLRERSWQGRTVVAVLRGLAIAVPIVLVFTVLLGSADIVFADFVDAVWKALALNPDSRLIDQALITLTIGWLSTGSLAYGLARRGGSSRSVTVGSEETESVEDAEAFFAYGDEQPVPMEAAQVRERPKRKTGQLFRLGMIETSIILGLVDGLFGIFVVVQFTYFFGGQDFLTSRGLTYAQYARRGFFELVAVAALTLGLALWLNHVTVRTERRDRRLFIALAVVVVALTSIMLVSAAQRMYLYEQAYGFTHLRVFTHVFMGWLGVLFVFFLASLFDLKPYLFTLGLLLTGIGYLFTLNVMNIDLYLAQRNIERFYQGSALDLSFLGRLSEDALPAVIAFYEDTADNPDAHDWAGQWLAQQLHALDLEHQKYTTLFSFNLARDESWAALDAMRSELPAYDPVVFGSYYNRSYYDIYYATPEPSSR